jgi:plastocyanin
MIKPGTTIKWTNLDDEPHTVADVNQRFKSPVLDTHDSWNHAFDNGGTFNYFCSIHPHMQGKVVVS